MEYKNAILVKRAGETVKFFRYWGDDKKGTCRVLIKFKDKKGAKQELTFKFKGTSNKSASIMCMEAVIKYWPRFNPQEHDLIFSSGHKHAIKKSH